ncbi:MAG: two-component system, NtrC family, response regulator PilR [Thermoanaerobaculia bacterium]|nr:two-component system, NtrC family, response regulator PilR [Thermoanaerobaculia bacterium]
MDLLIVDDEASLRDFLSIVFEEEGWRVETAASLAAARVACAKLEPDLILCDLMLPDGSGIDLLREVKAATPSVAVIMITAHTSTKSAVEALKSGAFDYIAKPFDIDELKIIVRNAVERKELEEENLHLRTALEERFTFSNIIGRSARMQEIFSVVQRIAKTTSTVLISGDSGTGKELIARAIHYTSGRRGKFVSINCGALPETLLESELFGHERGAFTGAIREKRGLFHEADRGTIFLDEIGETSTAMQIKLLRVLQDHVVRRVGSNSETQVEVRVIAATNRDLAESIKAGTFREDLFYRINVIPITLPPLRQRREDIALLVEHFIAKYSKMLGVPQKRISADAMRLIEKYHWPGNVRELENVIERMLALEASDVLTTKSLPEHVLIGGAIPNVTFDLPPEGISLENHLEGIGKFFMLKALERSGGVQTQAAELLRMSFRSFRYYAKKYELITRDAKHEEALEVENEK